MRKFLPFVLLMLLSGCGLNLMNGTALMSNVAMGGATVTSYSVIGKGPVDYALSQYLEQDCDIRNPKKYNGEYCIDPPKPPVDPVVYCYRSLGDTDCTNVLDPHHNNNNPIVRGNQAQHAVATPVSLTPSNHSANEKAPVTLTPRDVTRPALPPSAEKLSPKDMALQGS